MSYLSDEQFAVRADSHKNFVNRDKSKVVKLHNGGHPGGIRDYTNEQRAHTVLLARVMGREKASEVTGIPVGRISQYKQGRSTQGRTNEELREMVNAQVEPIRMTAADLVLRTLGVITPEEIGKQKVREKVAIARDLASIVEKTKPMIEEKQANVTANVVFYAPRVRGVDEYEKVS